MPVHNWTRVEAGIFHHFHNGWIYELGNALNDGLLPPGYYALGEQHAGRPIADVLTLHSTSARSRRRTLTVRHVTGHRIVALIEIVSPANKDRASHVAEFAKKVEGALHHGVHVSVVDLFEAGDVLPSAPLYLCSDRYINVPFEATYQAAFRSVPAVWRDVLERAGDAP